MPGAPYPASWTYFDGRPGCIKGPVGRLRARQRDVVAHRVDPAVGPPVDDEVAVGRVALGGGPVARPEVGGAPDEDL